MITKFCANSDTIHLGYFYVTIILNGEWKKKKKTNDICQILRSFEIKKLKGKRRSNGSNYK